ncbi:hypothetical protein B0H15DRAFT_815471 [Mycena belliarum]|uniref:DUF6533 domain-containing protein n=1 Tax=Mycena belliarum TaxID=1033014 RepID=A0AAD6UH71_9AGAR|nr:hypothetical protein B0H15DRAFT_815471 [Mycena belliae]
MKEVSTTQTIFFQNYCHLVGVSILVWDYIITLGVEVRYLWQPAKSASSYWFFTIRYGALGANIPVAIFSFVTLPMKSCIRYDLVHQLFMLATQLLVATVMILRVWALYGRQARVLWGLIGVSSALIAVSAWSLHRGQHGFPLTVLPGCHLEVVQAASHDLARPWECLFVFDSIMFGMTTYKGCATRHAIGGANMPLHRVLIRDGANIVTTVPGSLATFATCMSVVMMTRLMLNLHERTDIGVLTQLQISDIGDELASVDVESLGGS